MPDGIGRGDHGASGPRARVSDPSWLRPGALGGAIFAALAVWVLPAPLGWWVAAVTFLVVLAAARLTATEDVVELDDEALVRRTGRRATRLPLQAVDRVERRPLYRSGWELVVVGAGVEIVVPFMPETRAVREELGRRLAHRRDELVLTNNSGPLIGWDTRADR